jgi:hypothetical protein
MLVRSMVPICSSPIPASSTMVRISSSSACRFSPPLARFGYARVSTADQDPQLQLDALAT